MGEGVGVGVGIGVETRVETGLTVGTTFLLSRRISAKTTTTRLLSRSSLGSPDFTNDGNFNLSCI